MKEAHRSNDRKLQKIDHPQRYKRLEKASAVWVYVGSLTSSRPLQTEQSSHRRSSPVTHAEDKRLSEIGRSKLFDTPEERWAAANIEF